MLRKFFNDEVGAVVSAELILVITLTFCAAAVGWAVVSAAVVAELNDVSEMIGVMDQSYNVQGHSVTDGAGTKGHGQCSGFGYNDQGDICDCKPVVPIEVCGKNDPSGSGQLESASN